MVGPLIEKHFCIKGWIDSKGFSSLESLDVVWEFDPNIVSNDFCKRRSEAILDFVACDELK